jgi:hypothetical protein
MKKIWTKPYGTDGSELWIGVPSWQEPKEKLSIKFAYLKGGKVPRTAPEVPEEVVVDMVAMLAEHGRLTATDLDKLATVLQTARHR